LGLFHDVRCAESLQRREINVAPVVVGRSVTAAARDIRVHPVREYLSGIAGTAYRGSKPGRSPTLAPTTRR